MQGNIHCGEDNKSRHLTNAYHCKRYQNCNTITLYHNWHIKTVGSNHQIALQMYISCQWPISWNSDNVHTNSSVAVKPCQPGSDSVEHGPGHCNVLTTAGQKGHCLYLTHTTSLTVGRDDVSVTMEEIRVNILFSTMFYIIKGSADLKSRNLGKKIKSDFLLSWYQ